MTPTQPRTDQLAFDNLEAELRDLTFVIVDLETTGGPATQAGITEIGAVKVQGGEVLAEFATLVQPASAIPAHISALTGITDRMVADAPSVAGAVAAFGEFAGDAILVAHNAPYDLGFLKAACTVHDLSWFPGPSLDTARLARVALHPGEVRNCKLATLAQHFAAPVTPVHRALADAQATTHVLHCLLERVGSLGVRTWSDLRAFLGRVSKAQRAKRHLADGLPTGPGVYTFVDRAGAPLYIGTSMNVRNRVRSYFTAAENRARMAEMIGIAERVEVLTCSTALEARIRELRLIARRQPHYNRRSRRAATTWWLQLTDESAPRLMAIKTIDDSMPAGAWGPFTSRGQARSVAETIADSTGLRTCTDRIARNPSNSQPKCLLGHLGRCPAPCSSTGDRESYASAVAATQRLLSGDLRALLTDAYTRMAELAEAEHFEQARDVRDSTAAVCAASQRFHRARTIIDAGRVVAAERDSHAGWAIHVIDAGRLVAAAYAPPGTNPRDVRDAAISAADCEPDAVATAEETSIITAWLEKPNVRLISCRGGLSWPIGSGSNLTSVKRTVASVDADRSGAARPVGPAPGSSTVSRIRQAV